MPGKKEKSKWSFRSIFSRSKSKNAGQDSGINGTSVQKQQTPPSYTNIASGYKQLLVDADALGNAKIKHDKKDDLEKLHKKKSDLYQKYEEAISVSGANESTVQSWQRENMESNKQSAEIVFEATEKKVSKNIEAREALEKHKGTALVKVVQHATEVKKKDDVMEEDLFAPIQSGLTQKERKVQEDKRRALAAKKEELAEERKEAEAKNAKKESRDSKMEKAGFLSTMGGFLGTVFGSIADSAETLASAGVDTKSSLDSLKKGETGRLEFLKDNSTSWTGGLGIAAAGLSLISGIVSMVELGRGLVKTIKHSKKGHSDAQEKWLDARTALGNICETVSNLIGAVAPFTSMIPFLGSVLGIADSGLQMVVGSMNLATNSVHAVMMRHDKEKLWKEIERKRKKYVAAKNEEDARYFDVDSIGDNHTASQAYDRKQKFSSIDQKRRGLLKTVAEAQNIEKIERTAKTSKNASEFAGAEMEISTRLSAMRRDWHEGKLGMTREDYKKSMHQMEALQLMSQYRTAEKAAKKMHKAIGHDVEGLATNGTKIVGNALSLAGQITAASGFGATLIAAGVGVNMVEGAYEQGRTAGSFLYKQFRKFSGAQANKENTRAEMGAYLYDKMISLGSDNVEWDNNFFKLDGVPDYRIREESKSMNELYSIVRRGLDARVSTLLGATTADDMKGALAEAFGQED